jgi:AcrR family transcriptional regulator
MFGWAITMTNSIPGITERIAHRLHKWEDLATCSSTLTQTVHYWEELLGYNRHMASADQHAPARSDALRSRARLIDAVEQLLNSGRTDFSLPELASEAGVGVATAYRHYASPSDALQAYAARAVGELVDSFAGVDVDGDPLLRFRHYCARWVAQGQLWGSAVRHIRSPKGFIERLNQDDPSIVALHTILVGVLDDLMARGAMPTMDRTFAVLLWITIFDERVIYDLTEHHHWNSARITNHLTAAAAGALQIRIVE